MFSHNQNDKLRFFFVALQGFFTGDDFNINYFHINIKFEISD